MGSPYAVLGVDSDADDETVEAAYRDRIKEAHPDHGGSVEAFRTVRTAYESIQAGYEPDSQTGVNGTARKQNGDDEATVETATTAVTYLDYDVLADYGWTTDDADLFEKAAGADLDTEDFGQFEAKAGESLLEAAESRGFAWPFACRGGACANCAILLHEGELSMPASHVLPSELLERDIRLSCNAMPITDELRVVYNVKHMPVLEELLLPPRPFEQAHLDD